MDDVEQQLTEAYNALQDARAKEAINMLRLRADMADAIEQAHQNGLSNYRIAQLLETDRTAIARMSRGVWLPPGQKAPTVEAVLAAQGLAAVPRSSVPAEAHSGAEGVPDPDAWKKVPRPTLVCRYCSDKASYAINMADGKSILVCANHKPKERADDGNTRGTT